MVAALGSGPRGVLEPAALASLLIDSAKATRNSRTRCECLLQVADLLRGMQCLASPVKLVNGLAAFIQQEGDLASKGAALEALAAAHALLGQRIWKMLAALDNRSRQVIAQRIEKAGNVAAQPGGLQDGGRPEGHRTTFFRSCPGCPLYIVNRRFFSGDLHFERVEVIDRRKRS